MRIDARKLPSQACVWFVWDCERCLKPRPVWVDDETAQWGRYVEPLVIMGDEMAIETLQERRIDIYPAERLVLFNQVEDIDADAVPLELMLAR